MSQLLAAFTSSHSPMLTSELEDWAVNIGTRDATRPHIDLAGQPTTFADLLANAPANAAGRITRQLLAQRREATLTALTRLREDIARAKLDALIVIGDGPKELFDHTNMPAIGLWYGETIPNAPRPAIAAPSGRIARGHITWKPSAPHIIPAIEPWRCI